MKGLRFWILATLGWFFFFYNIERLDGPINIASFVYVYAIVLAALIILFQGLQKIPTFWLCLLPLPVFFALKIWLGYPIGNSRLPYTVTEICALCLTVVLARRIGLGLEEFRETGINLMMLEQLNNRVQPFETGQAEIYREIQRARLFQRPLSLLAVAIDGKGEDVNFSLDRLTKEVQKQVVQKYMTARLANLLLEQMNDCNIVTQRDDHFIILLPEIDRENVDEVIRKLEIAAQEKLGLQLNFGTSVFPDEEVTFGKLMEHAEAFLRTSPGKPKPEGADLFSKPVDVV